MYFDRRESWAESDSDSKPIDIINNETNSYTLCVTKKFQNHNTRFHSGGVGYSDREFEVIVKKTAKSRDNYYKLYSRTIADLPFVV